MGTNATNTKGQRSPRPFHITKSMTALSTARSNPPMIRPAPTRTGGSPSVALTPVSAWISVAFVAIGSPIRQSRSF